jgi:beta-galactosidase
MWRAPYSPGIIKAIARKNESEILTKEIKTAGKPAKIILEPDRKEIKADGRDLSFVTVKIVDKEGTVVPYADNLVNFTVEGEAFIAGVDNGNQISHEPFKANYRKAFNGMCLVVLQSKGAASEIKLTAESEALEAASMIIEAKN